MQAKFLFDPLASYAGTGKFQIPVLRPCNPDLTGKQWIPFNLCRSSPSSRSEKVVHFFIHDHLFERVWNTRSTMHWIYGYAAATTPDFSTYTDMPLAYQIWQRFRAMYIGAYMQQTMGLQVIPTLAWSTEDSFEFTFDGISRGSAVALNSTGIEKEGVKDLHLAGLQEALKRIDPSIVYVYGGSKPWYPDWNYVNIPTFCNLIAKREKASKVNKRKSVPIDLNSDSMAENQSIN